MKSGCGSCYNSQHKRVSSVILHTMLGVAIYWKLKIQTSIASDSTDVEIKCVYKAVKKTKVIHKYMKALAIHTVSQTVHWEDNTR